jgi:5-methylcytosine-specific restriction protein A
MLAWRGRVQGGFLMRHGRRAMFYQSRSIVCAGGVTFAVKRRKGNRPPKQNKTLLSLGYENYADYLAGSAWKSIRAAKLAVDPLCEICGHSAAAVHHIDYGYSTLAGRNARGLVSVCCQCHRDIEFTSAGRKRPFKVTRNITERLLKQAGKLAEHL